MPETNNRLMITMQNDSKFIEIANGVLISTPTSLHSITSYVLEEQGDWFEDEIRFVRKLLKEGDTAIDIGANQGVYTLSMAKIVGPSGKIWAFEPTNSTATFLENGIFANKFTQVTLVKKALSNYCGEANFNIFENSEMNSLTLTYGKDLPTQKVDVTTMDACDEEYGWSAIKFIKIDAEGEERNILSGGIEFFKRNSPLIMCENPNSNHSETPIFNDFLTLGYFPFRLVSGLGILIPVCPELPPDRYIFNIFFCKKDRSLQLAEAGLLLQEMPPVFSSDMREANNLTIGNFSRYASTLPYSNGLIEDWHFKSDDIDGRRILEALNLYVSSKDPTNTISSRFSTILSAYILLKEVCDRAPSFLRLFSLARVANELGSREEALLALHRLLNAIQLDGKYPLGLNEPFLAPIAYFEYVPIKNNDTKNWVLAAMLETLEKLLSHSSCYAEVDDMLLRLRIIRSLGYGSEEMYRRMKLVEKIHGVIV